MQTLNQVSVTKRSRRTASILQIETDLVRRFEEFLGTWVSTVGSCIDSALEMRRISEFADTFVEDFHFRRVEAALMLCQRSGDRRLGIWAAKFAEHHVKLRERMAGMGRAAKSSDTGAPTAFRWAATSLVKVLRRYLEWADSVLLPELRLTVSDALDQVIANALRLDEAKEVSHYAQAESLLMGLK
ncbi:MAG: hemerythrin-like domain-containing protein [Planctomycetota bacterium]|jgi:hemerythrin-like domain-containing protein